MPLTAREKTRKGLLPIWVRAFCWLFLVAGAITPTLLVAGMFVMDPMRFSLFGWEHIGSPYDACSLLILGFFVAMSVAAYGLLWGKSWGWAAGVAIGSLGLALALLAYTRQTDGESYYPLEPLFQIPFLYG